MNNKIRIFTILITLITGTFAFAQNTPGAYSPEVSKAFAFDLYQTGFYPEAEVEFRRYLFSTKSPIDESAVLTLSSIYNSTDNLTGSNWMFENLFSKVSLFAQEKLSLVQGRLVFKTQKVEDFKAFQDFISPFVASYSQDFQNILSISDLVLNKNIKEAKEFTKQVAETDEAFVQLSDFLGSYKQKSPGLSLFLSMICPGAGKWYSGSFSQGASSFLSIASFVSATVYTGMQSEWKSWQPYVYGSCGLVLYIVELYGAYQAAKRYNAAAYRDLCLETENVYEALY